VHTVQNSKVLLLYLLLLYPVLLYNRITVIHELHVLDKASKDKVIAGSIFNVKFLLQLPAKRQTQALSFIDYPAEPYLLTVLVKVKKILQNVPAR